MLNLDTHTAVAVLNGNRSEPEHRLVSAEPLAISSIVLWELAKLVQLKRLILDMESSEFREFLRQTVIIPISLQGTQLEFQSDPADGIIAATSLVERIPLLTRDRKLLKSRVVPLAVSNP